MRSKLIIGAKYFDRLGREVLVEAKNRRYGSTPIVVRRDQDGFVYTLSERGRLYTSTKDSKDLIKQAKPKPVAFKRRLLK